MKYLNKYLFGFLIVLSAAGCSEDKIKFSEYNCSVALYRPCRNKIVSEKTVAIRYFLPDKNGNTLNPSPLDMMEEYFRFTENAQTCEAYTAGAAQYIFQPEHEMPKAKWELRELKSKIKILRKILKRNQILVFLQIPETDFYLLRTGTGQLPEFRFVFHKEKSGWKFCSKPPKPVKDFSEEWQIHLRSGGQDLPR